MKPTVYWSTRALKIPSQHSRYPQTVQYERPTEDLEIASSSLRPGRLQIYLFTENPGVLSPRGYPVRHGWLSNLSLLLCAVMVTVAVVKCGPVFAYISNKEFEVSKNQNTFVW